MVDERYSRWLTFGSSLGPCCETAVNRHVLVFPNIVKVSPTGNRILNKSQISVQFVCLAQVCLRVYFSVGQTELHLSSYISNITIKEELTCG